MQFITATEARRQFFTLLESAKRKQVTCVTHEGLPKAVVLSFDEYQKLTGGETPKAAKKFVSTTVGSAKAKVATPAPKKKSSFLSTLGFRD